MDGSSNILDISNLFIYKKKEKIAALSQMGDFSGGDSSTQNKVM